MIVRILGEGQYEVPDTERTNLDGLEATLNTAVDGQDEAAFATALSTLIEAVKKAGELVPPDTFTSSDLVVPFSDATLAETKALLAEPGGDHS